MKNKTVYWKTAAGDLMDVDKMSEQHLRNVLKMILRKQQASKVLDVYDFEGDEEVRGQYLFNDDEARGNQW